MFEDDFFRNNLRKKRQELNLTQKDIAKAIGVTPQTLSGYEKQGGKLPTLDTAAKLADCLGVSLDWLAGNPRTPQKDKPETVADVARGLVWFYEYGWSNRSPANLSRLGFVREENLVKFCNNWGAIWELEQSGSLKEETYQQLLKALVNSLSMVEYQAAIDDRGEVSVFPVDLEEEMKEQEEAYYEELRRKKEADTNGIHTEEDHKDGEDLL